MLHAAASFAHVQVKAGTIFDNILVCDDPEFAKTEAEKNIVPLQAKEKEMKKKADDEEAEKRRKEEVCITPAFCGLSSYVRERHKGLSGSETSCSDLFQGGSSRAG